MLSSLVFLLQQKYLKKKQALIRRLLGRAQNRGESRVMLMAANIKMC